VEEGELTERGAQLLQGLWDTTAPREPGWTGVAERHLQIALQRLNLPSHDDVQRLRAQLDELTGRLEDLDAVPSPMGEGE
jgi:polyhydroxyalkanoate synthesis regulator phasin